MKNNVFWEVTPCSLVDINIKPFTVKMESAYSYETLVNISQATWCHIPELFFTLIAVKNFKINLDLYNI